MPYETWSKGEKAIARRAFEQAYARECLALAGEVRRRAISIAEPNDMSKERFERLRESVIEAGASFAR